MESCFIWGGVGGQNKVKHLFWLQNGQVQGEPQQMKLIKELYIPSLQHHLPKRGSLFFSLP